MARGTVGAEWRRGYRGEMATRILAPVLLAALTAASPTPTLACSVGSDYRVPTNLELAGDAEVILVGRVIDGVLMGEAAPHRAFIRVAPVAVLKGALPGDPLVLEGLSLAEDRYAVLSNPYELNEAHPVTYVGACIRYAFPIGTQVLFFLKRHEDGRWGPAGGPFSRWAEDALDREGPWPVLAALYARAAALSEPARQTLLEGERDRLLAEPNDPVARLMAADIARQLAGPNAPLRGRLPDEDDAAEDAEPTG